MIELRSVPRPDPEDAPHGLLVHGWVEVLGARLLAIVVDANRRPCAHVVRFHGWREVSEGRIDEAARAVVELARLYDVGERVALVVHEEGGCDPLRQALEAAGLPIPAEAEVRR